MSGEHRYGPVEPSHHAFHHANEDALYGDLQAENERLRKVHDLCHALARWMAKHDDICPLDDEADALLAPFYARAPERSET